MSTQQIPMWTVTCDHDGCRVNLALITDGEQAAWDDRDHAEDVWVDHGGQMVADGRAMCSKHTLPECAMCGEWHPLLAYDRDGCPVCPRCVDDINAVEATR